jgi:hypothetical protein
MSVIKRLQRLTGESPRQINHRSEEIAELRRRIDAIMARRSAGAMRNPVQRTGHRFPSLEEVIPGIAGSNDAGTCYIQEHRIDALSSHGCHCIGDLAETSMRSASFLANDASLAGFRLEDGLFLDTETTGLAGGTGTMAFLIGLGWFDRESFIVRQIFARDFSEERAALNQLSHAAIGRRFLVSFNGKSFDVGLLSTRYIMNRLENPFSDMPHLDLLYPARRLIAHRLENCRLATLEAQILGFIRQGDVPGSEIPQRYFDWLRFRDASLLRDVFEHNRLDVISLAALMGHLTAVLHGRRDAVQMDARDILAAARLCIERRETQRAQSLLASVSRTDGTAARMEASKMKSLLHKRAGRWDKATEIWLEMIGDDPGNLFALIELAKWYEHRAHDAGKALKMVALAIGQPDTCISPIQRASLLRRQERLLRRRDSEQARLEARQEVIDNR